LKKKENIFYVSIIIFLLAVRIFFLQPVKVQGNSMQPTLSSGDFALLLKTSSNIKTGDIIVLEKELTKEHLIKRVIASEGQKIEIEDNQVKLDGVLLTEDYLIDYSGLEDFTYGNGLIRYIVPENHFFVLGDNRLNSQDSRQLGLVQKENILGKVVWSVGFRFY
jgi:signal peptidase I